MTWKERSLGAALFVFAQTQITATLVMRFFSQLWVGEMARIYKDAVKAAEASGAKPVENADGYVLYEYPDYETYCRVQQEGNIAKLKRQFVKRSHIDRLANYLLGLGRPLGFGLCHGTRAGREQAWFAEALEGCNVVGTEISETATQFANTVQWDFHNENSDWIGRADFVYSNSWDHAFAPRKAFSAWIDQLAPGGLLLLDYTKGQAPSAANALDPFGVDLPVLVKLLKQVAGARCEAPQLHDYRDNPEYGARVVTLRRR